MGQEIKGSIIGVISTIMLFFVPLINVIAPIIGGAIGGYTAANGINGGIKVGALMSVFMILPGFLISGIIGTMLHDIPVLGAVIGSGGIILTIIIVAETAVFGTIGAIIGGLVGGKKELSRR